MRTTFPAPHEIDDAALQKTLSKPAPTTQFVILFTPRAGSTWLTDVASQTGKLSKPDELFNPRHLNKMAKAVNAPGLEEYCAAIARKRATDGVFGFEITHHQLRAVFRTDAKFRQFYPNPYVFWLTRKDIVAQAVSLHKMTTTKVSHATKLSAEEIAAREDDFQYDAGRIAHWIDHIVTAELRTEALMDAAGWTPMRLWYEWNVEVGAQVTLNRMAEFMGMPPVQRGSEPPSGHRKIGTGKNAEFGDRFRAERPEFLAEIDGKRAKITQGHVPYRQQLTQLARAEAA